MNQSFPGQQSPGLLPLTMGIMICLTLLITASFKIIMLDGMVFSLTSVICPVIAGLYLMALRHCSFKEQRHLLNISLMTLYIFCIGVYVLINLPAAEFMHNNPVYQIIFDDIPKKFFAVTMAFALSFYFPHLLFCTKTNKVLESPRRCMLLALCGGFTFFILNLYLLLSGVHIHNSKQIMMDSILIASLLLLLISIIYLTFLLKNSDDIFITKRHEDAFPLWYYMICFAIIIMLICLACEYRIVSIWGQNGVLAASTIFFPITLMINTLIGELWGYKVNIKSSLIIIATQFIFDVVLLVIVALPSPDFFNLNPYYSYVLVRRLPATFLTLSATYLSNALLLHYLKQHHIHRALRILIANICANSLLCLIDYSLLFAGIYSYDQILGLVFNVWQYKLAMTVISLPMTLRLFSYFGNNKALNLRCGGV